MLGRIFLFFAFAFFANLAGAQDRVPGDSTASFLGKIFGKQEDFAELKKLRRSLVAEITRLERDLKAMESQAEQLTLQLEDAPSELARLNGQLRLLERLLVETQSSGAQANAPSTVVRPTATEKLAAAADRFRSEAEFLASRPPDELRSRKTDLEQRVKDISDKQQRLTSTKDDQRKKRDELEHGQARLVELEDRISVSLSTATNQYIYRTVVSLIFAGIVAYLVSQFFSLVRQNEEIKINIFSGDTGIQFITLFSIVIAVILFGILEILGANELSALLGGLSGYILGKSSSKPGGGAG